VRVSDLRLFSRNILALVLAPAVIVVASCGGRVSASGAGGAASLTIHAEASRIDTNGSTRYSATLADGAPARVVWSVSGGDPRAGAGSINAEGIYTPPSFLTQEAATVAVNAVLAEKQGGEAATSGSALLTVTPGFLQPLTPGNLSVGPNGTATISGSMTEVGGSGAIRFTLAADAAGTPNTVGTLSAPHCVRGSVEGGNPAYTVCSVTYAAPPAVPASASVFIVGSIFALGLASGPASGASNPAVSWTRVLLNAAGINSNPVTHQARLTVPVMLGSSSGNNADYDAAQGQVADCCGGTLGSLLQDASGTQYVLSNNHVLARSDQSLPGETIIQPGLIDNGCTPYGVGPGTTPVATLSGYPALNSPAGNVDAAIARVTAGAVDPKGNIQELGAKQPDGTLAAAPPGISSTGGKGEAASLGMLVAKSGRTTGLTCAAVSAVSVDVVVEYFTDCAETAHSFSKTFTNQIAMAGTSFSDAGDSGALVVDTANAEPVGLFFAGGTDTNGVEHAIANPAGDVLTALDAQVPGAAGGPASYSFVGGADHPVSCLSYGAPKAIDEAAAVAALSAAERERVEAALLMAQSTLNAAGIVRVGMTASKDHPGEGALAVYVEPANGPIQSIPAIPAAIGGVATVVIPTGGQPGESGAPYALSQPRAASFSQVLAAKQRHAAALFKSNPALFGVGVGQSLDNPADAALILFLDRRKATGPAPETLRAPETIDGQRVRAILMDRFHVTRSHGQPARSASTCSPEHRVTAAWEEENDGFDPAKPEPLLRETPIRLPD
jgi:hypothetical protein